MPADRFAGHSDRSWVSTALLALILVAALGLRLYGLNWDGGSLFHPDERMIMMTVQGGLSLTPFDLGHFLDPKTSPLNPHFFAYGSFPLYLLKVVGQLLSVFQQSLADQNLRLVGRVISALFDTGTVLLVYLLGGRIFGKRAGLLAAAFVAFAVLHVQLSHFYTVDVILSFLIVLTVYFCLDIVERGTTRAALLTGAALGLALATKVSVLPLLLAVAVAYLLYCISPDSSRVTSLSFSFPRLQRSVLHLALTAAVAGVVFLIAEPYALIDHTTFLANFTEQGEMVRRIRDYPYTRQYIGAPLYLYEFQQLTVWGLGPALGLSFWAGLLFTIVVAWRSRRKSDILLLAWVIPYFLITGWFPVKFLRYLLPMVPFMALMAARMFTDVREWLAAPMADTRGWSALVRRLLGNPGRSLDALLAAVMVLTVFYALAYDNIYSAPHTAIQAANWINTNVPKGATIVKEHWEEGLPNLVGYQTVEIGPYDPDESPDKWRDMLSKLERADYIVFYSNRLYGTIPRLPDRYPFTTTYYKQLFSGQLGFELAYAATDYPNLLGVSFVSDTFSRPGLTPPAALRDFDTSPLAVQGGFADESFSVYDHPMTMVFARQKSMSQAEMRASLGITDLGPRVTTPNNKTGLMLSPSDLAANQQGGTWSELFDRNGLVNRLPTLVWLLAAELIFLITLPLGLLLFKALPDRGYLLTKSLGLLLLAYISWMISSLHLLPFSRWSIVLSGLLILLGSAAAVWRRRDELTAFLVENRRLIVIFELVFLTAFVVFWFLRLANPDLWHPARGGEKPMDFAYLNAVTKTTYFPPYDPWFAGGFLNYYYFGQVILATLIKLTGIIPSTAFNLAIPLLFACTVGGAFSVAFNLVAGRQRSHGAIGQDSAGSASEGLGSVATPFHEPEGALGSDRDRLPRMAIYCGLAAGVFVAVLGNLDGLLQLLDGLWKASGSTFSSSLPLIAGVWNTLTGLYQVALGGKALPAFDYWRSSRMMPPTPNITEFPFFTFLFADLHAHLIALPFTLLSLGLALSIVFHGWRQGARAALAVAQAADLPEPQSGPSLPQSTPSIPSRPGQAPTSLLERVLTNSTRVDVDAAPSTRTRVAQGLSALLRQTDVWGLIAASLVLGALRVINSWDFPTYLAVACVSLFAGDYFARRRVDAQLIMGVFLKSLVLYALSTLLFLPFHRAYQLFYSGIQPSPERTDILQYLGVHGFFLACVGSMIVLEIGRRWRRNSAWRVGALFIRRWDHLPRLVPLFQRLTRTNDDQVAGTGWLLATVAVILLALLAFRLYLFAFLGVFLAAVCVLGIGALRRREAGQASLFFVMLMMAGALSLGVGIDLVVIQGDVGRMNTVFKFYLQSWVLMAVSSAYALWWLSRWISARGRLRRRLVPRLWAGGLAFLFLSTTIYPLAATPVRLRDRFQPTPLTTDGTAYMQNAEYQDEKGKLTLKWDEEGIRWLQDNVQGSPVILEGSTPLYRWGSRISVYTGLPTVIGWDWHQKQQRWGYQATVDSRLSDVKTMYTSPSPEQTLGLLKKYNVRYIYVGELERNYYPGPGLAKFDAMMGTDLTLVYQNEKVKIYEVNS